MNRPSPRRQQGFGLLAFVALVSAIAFSLVIGYSSVLTREHANSLQSNQQAWLDETLATTERFYRQHAMQLDDPASGVAVSDATFIKAAGISLKYGATLWVSDRLPASSEGLPHRKVVVFVSTETDEANPPDEATFRTTGKFVSCSNSSAECASRKFAVFDSLDVQRALLKDTEARLARVAFKAQGYFKARVLQDPERNIGINYYRTPNGACEAMEMDLECLDTYTPLIELAQGASLFAGPSLSGTTVPSRTADRLGLADDELTTAWGTALEASNKQDSQWIEPPYTMKFRARLPGGNYLSITAVQPL